jgi:hypothetical protein
MQAEPSQIQDGGPYALTIFSDSWRHDAAWVFHVIHDSLYLKLAVSATDWGWRLTTQPLQQYKKMKINIEIWQAWG